MIDNLYNAPPSYQHFQKLLSMEKSNSSHSKMFLLIAEEMIFRSSPNKRFEVMGKKIQSKKILLCRSQKLKNKELKQTKNILQINELFWVSSQSLTQNVVYHISYCRNFHCSFEKRHRFLKKSTKDWVEFVILHRRWTDLSVFFRKWITWRESLNLQIFKVCPCGLLAL